MTENLYKTLGGEGAIKALVESFYQKVLSDQELIPYFQGRHLGRLKQHQALFLSQALGGPKQYKGRQMRESHEGLGITSAHFMKVAGYLEATLTELGVPADQISEVLALVGSLKGEIVNESAEIAPAGVELPEQEEAPAAEPVEPAPEEAVTLYAKLGGEGVIRELVEEFYGRVLPDPLLAPVFKGIDPSRLKRHQALFLSQVLGGPKHYDGRGMFEAHKAYLITEEQFSRVATHLMDSLAVKGVSQDEIDAVMALIAPLKRQIVMNHFQRWLRSG